MFRKWYKSLILDVFLLTHFGKCSAYTDFYHPLYTEIYRLRSCTHVSSGAWATSVPCRELWAGSMILWDFRLLPLLLLLLLPLLLWAGSRSAAIYQRRSPPAPPIGLFTPVIKFSATNQPLHQNPFPTWCCPATIVAGVSEMIYKETVTNDQ